MSKEKIILNPKAEEATRQQKIASNPSKSIWVSASAGTGKTTTLTKRLIRLLLSGVEPSKILCLTYTKVGAVHMYKKIHEKLAKFAIMSEDALKVELEKLIGVNVPHETLKNARTLFAKVLDNGNDFKILTIHAFCEKIIKKFPIEAGIMPNFEIADDSYSKRLIEEAKDLLFKDIDEETKKCIEEITLYKNDDDLINMLSELLGKKDKIIYLREMFFGDFSEIEKELYKIFSLKSKIDDIEKNFFKNEINKDNILNIANILDSVGEVEKASILKQYWNSDRKKNFKVYSDFFLTKDGSIRKKHINKNITELLPQAEDFALAEAERITEYIDDCNSYKIISLTTNLLKLSYKILDIYTELKRQNGVLDYGDLIIYTNKLLSESGSSDWVAYKLDSGIEHFLLDEAQDTSFSQWKIVNLLTSEFFVGDSASGKDRTIFVVGDEKQSIFEFQDAKPELFKIMNNNYEVLAKEAYKDFETIYSQVSFRSLPIILNLTDTIFNEESRKNIISKLEKNIEHKNVREGDGKVELYLIEGEEEKEEEFDKLPFERKKIIKAEEKTAIAIVQKIRALVDGGRLIKKRKVDDELAPINYGDIMILLKNRDKVFLNYLIKELNKNNIPNSGNDKFSLLDSIIIEDLISLAKFILFNEDDLNLANIIKSPLINLNEDDLYNLCEYKDVNKFSLWKALKDLDKYKETKEYLEDLIEKNKVMRPYELFYYILEKLDGKRLIKQRFIFEKTEDLLNEFLSYIGKYEEENKSPSLLGFIDYFNSENAEIKKDMDSNEDYVKILTAHSSKGLESPIVILANVNHTSQNVNHAVDIVWYEDFNNNYEVPLFNLSKNSRSKFLEEAYEKVKRKEYNEYLRLLYVAVTRAENELYVFGSKKKSKNKEANDNSWFSIIEDATKKMNIETLSFVKDDFYENKKAKKDEERIDKKILALAEEYKKDISNEKKNLKIINPSKYYSHKDRDNLVLEMPLSIKKGNAIHKLLELVPSSSMGEKSAIIDFYLKNSFPDLVEYYSEIKENVLNVLNNDEFKVFFSQRSKAEVPVVGKINGDIISGQIDRIVIEDKKVLILDYKNTQNLPQNRDDINKNYIKQLELYKMLIEQIYPNKIVECYILWTSFCKLSKIF